MSLHVYIDESGETGSRSKYIIFASIETENPRQLEKAIKRIWRAKPQLHAHGELHANSVNDATRIRVLHILNELDLKIKYLAVDKSKVTEKLEYAYYIYLARFVRYHNEAQVIIIDKKNTDKKRKQLIADLGLTEVYKKVIFEESHKVKQLQAVDFAAWAIGRKYELGDKSFIKIINAKQVK